MTLAQWIGIPVALATLAFIVFCFRQGQKVKPDSDGAPRVDFTSWRGW